MEDIAMAAKNGPTSIEKKKIIRLAIRLAEQEMVYRVELFNRYKESELYTGENSCIDRRPSKYGKLY